MVSLDVIKASNARLQTTGAPKVVVFVGGTSGIGHATFTELVKSSAATKVYLIGRPSSAERIKERISDLGSKNPNADIIWTQGEISLLSEVKRICDVIKTQESTIDLLFMSSGLLPFSGRKDTAEGIDTSQSLQYFARMAFIINLAPLLRTSNHGRVVSVLGGGAEKADIDVDDLELKKPGAFGTIRNQAHLIAMNTLMMEKLAQEEPTITFVHSLPGPVSTGNVAKDLPMTSPLGLLLRGAVQPLVKLVGLNPEESGQRHLFVSTSAFFGGKGVSCNLPAAKNTMGNTAAGLFLVNPKGEAGLNDKELPKLRERAQEKVWNLTKAILGTHM